MVNKIKIKNAERLIDDHVNNIADFAKNGQTGNALAELRIMAREREVHMESIRKDGEEIRIAGQDGRSIVVKQEYDVKSAKAMVELFTEGIQEGKEILAKHGIIVGIE